MLNQHKSGRIDTLVLMLVNTLATGRTERAGGSTSPHKRGSPSISPAKTPPLAANQRKERGLQRSSQRWPSADAEAQAVSPDAMKAAEGGAAAVGESGATTALILATIFQNEPVAEALMADGDRHATATQPPRKRHIWRVLCWQAAPTSTYASSRVTAGPRSCGRATWATRTSR